MAPSNATTNAATKPTEVELVITRTFDAPRRLVFEAWTAPEHLERWQGAPEGFTVTAHEVDFRPGGTYRLCMRSAEGVDHWLTGVYREIIEPERLVFTHAWLDGAGKRGVETLVTIVFAERHGKTTITLRQTGFTSVESHNGHNVGWTSTFDRLAQYLVEELRRQGRA